MNKAIFLDRDGVINKSILKNGKPIAPFFFKDFELIAGVIEAAQKLHDAGFLLIVTTNQPDVAKGLAQKSEIEAMHAFLLEKMPLKAIKACFHVDEDHCNCRKPKPGMLTEAAEEFNIDLKSSIMIGDRWRDVDAGKNAGCKTIYIESDYEERIPTNYDWKAQSLSEAASIILKAARRIRQ